MYGCCYRRDLALAPSQMRYRAKFFSISLPWRVRWRVSNDPEDWLRLARSKKRIRRGKGGRTCALDEILASLPCGTQIWNRASVWSEVVPFWRHRARGDGRGCCDDEDHHHRLRGDQGSAAMEWVSCRFWWFHCSLESYRVFSDDLVQAAVHLGVYGWGMRLGKK